MQRDNTNIYKMARMNTGLTQERAAELLDLSVESVKAYETGQRVPPDQTVALMADVYGSAWLRLEHGRATDALGLIPQEAATRPMEQTVLRLHRGMSCFAESERRLMEIAENGEIDADEWEDFRHIRAVIGSVVAACLELQCCEGAKKERPEGATSKRSRSTGVVPIRATAYKEYRNSIAHSRGIATKICAGEGVTSP